MLNAIRNEGRTLERGVVDITRVGTMVRNPRHIVVKIKAGTLTGEQERQLEEYVGNQVAEEV